MLSPHILIVKSRKGKKYPEELRRYISSKGVDCLISDWEPALLRETITKNNLKASNTLIHARAAGRKANLIFEELGKEGFNIVNNPKTLALTSNKYEAQIFATKHNLPAVKSYLVDKADRREFQKLLDKHRTIVVKPEYGQGGGQYCLRITSDIPVEKLLNQTTIVPGNKLLVQEFINYQSIVRTVVVGGKVLRSAITFAEPVGDWKCSICMNPYMKKYKSGDVSLIRLSEKTTKLFNAEITYIDFFLTKEGGYILNELNTACSLIIQERITGVPIHKIIGDYLIEKAKNV